MTEHVLHRNIQETGGFTEALHEPFGGVVRNGGGLEKIYPAPLIDKNAIGKGASDIYAEAVFPFICFCGRCYFIVSRMLGLAPKL